MPPGLLSPGLSLAHLLLASAFPQGVPWVWAPGSLFLAPDFLPRQWTSTPRLSLPLPTPLLLQHFCAQGTKPQSPVPSSHFRSAATSLSDDFSEEVRKERMTEPDSEQGGSPCILSLPHHPHTHSGCSVCRRKRRRKMREKGQECQPGDMGLPEIRSMASISFFYLFGFLGPCLRHMEVPRLGVESELQLLYPSCVCDLHHSSRQRQIPNTLSKARDRTRVLRNASWVH